MLLALLQSAPPKTHGRALYLMLSWLLDPIAADRMDKLLFPIGAAAAALRGRMGLQHAASYWNSGSVLCWCAETGIVKSRLCG